MFIPRIGMEVLVQFLEGDPDQPLITGCVYNPSALPPYELPDYKTRTIVFKSNSSKGGGGFNEIRVEDKKGEEQVFFHAEKNQDVRVKNDNKEWIGQDRYLIVKRDQIEQVQKDKHLLVKGDQTEKVDGNVHLKAGSNKEQKIGSKFAVDAGMEVHLKAGMSVTIEAGTQITLKAGGSFVNVGPAGVAIKGAMVMLNSGGGAGSGGGASPGTPKDPLEADTADPGRGMGPRPPNPPARYVSIAEEARAKVNAEKEAAKKAEWDKYKASLPVPPDHEIIEALKKGVGSIFTASPVNIPAVEKRLTERDYKALLDAAQWVPSPQGGKIKILSRPTEFLERLWTLRKKMPVSRHQQELIYLRALSQVRPCQATGRAKPTGRETRRKADGLPDVWRRRKRRKADELPNVRRGRGRGKGCRRGGGVALRDSRQRGRWGSGERKDVRKAHLIIRHSKKMRVRKNGKM
jgi:hypothetical protein